MNDVHTTLDSDFDENSITTPEEVANTPWETDYYGKKIIEPLANGRDIYYHIESTNNCADIWQKAIDNWNELGVIKFVPTNSTDDKHVLTLNDTNEPIGGNNNWSGIAYNTRTGYYPGELAYNQCSLKTNDMNNAQGYTDYQKICVAEHELGHVLGFAHDSRTYLNNSVEALMNPVAEEGGTKDFLQLDAGATQQFALAQNYNLSILPGSMPFKELNLKIYRDGNYERLDDSVPNKDVPYDFTTNTFTTVDAHE